LIHEGGFRIERTVDAIRCFDPFGDEVPISAERRFRGNVSALFEADAALGISIDSQTTVPEWYGERPDYDHILWVLGTGSSPESRPTRRDDRTCLQTSA
jgi:hypothetical protein